MLKTTTLQVIPELPDDIPGQDLTLRRQHVLEMRPVLLDQLVKQRVLWLMCQGRDTRGLGLAAVLDRTLVVFEPQGRSRHHSFLKGNTRLYKPLD